MIIVIQDLAMIKGHGLRKRGCIKYPDLRGIIRGPGNPFGQPFYRFDPICYLLMEATAHPQAVADFIACATTTEAALKLGPTTFPPTNDWTLDRRVETSSLGEGIGWWFEQWQDIHRGAGSWATSSYPARADVIPFFHQQVVGLLRGETTPGEAIRELMSRPLRVE